MKECPCGSAKLYSECCEPFHLGKEAETALALMRSRYSAYAKRLPEYIQRTTHPKSPHFEINRKKWTKHILNFCDTTEFVRLEILGYGEDWVHFIAHLKQGDEPVELKEKSRFERLHSNWRYLSAAIEK